jgi:signal peptidase I
MVRIILKAAIWLLVVVIVAFGVGMLFFKSRTAGDDSMAPGLMAGDKYLLCYRCDVEKGDPVLCDHPDPARKGVQILGRVVGMEGDNVEVKSGLLRVNGRDKTLSSDGKPFEYYGRQGSERVRHSFQIWWHPSLFGDQIYVLYPRPGGRNKVSPSNQLVPDRPPQVVQRGHYFLMGDNRTLLVGRTATSGGTCNSSFCYGQVPAARCHGVPYFIYSAADRGFEGQPGARRLSFVP